MTPTRTGLVAIWCTFAALACSSRADAPAAAPPQGGQENMPGETYTKPADAELRKKLSALEYEVTQRDATEPPFRNRFWDNHEDGLYVDVVTGEPLFSSRDKFESGTGWPSFTQPVDAERVRIKRDVTHGMVRDEARSRVGDSHLGHVFPDGPPPTGLRYCINSASLRFIPAAELAKAGYGTWSARFGGEASHPPAKTDNACAPTPAGGAVMAGNAAGTEAGADGASCQATLETVVLAGGCFWGMEDLLREIPGVLETEVGYAGGQTEAPVYESVKTGRTGHAESVRVVFDPAKLKFEDLLENWFFRMHDPTTRNRQGNDVGTQYRSVIFYTTQAQRAAAAKVIARVDASGRWKAPVVTELVAAGPFTAAEDYHQDYLEKHPNGYTCHFMRD